MKGGWEGKKDALTKTRRKGTMRPAARMPPYPRLPHQYLQQRQHRQHQQKGVEAVEQPAVAG